VEEETPVAAAIAADNEAGDSILLRIPHHVFMTLPVLFMIYSEFDRFGT
jgi:uncharacterized membrane protein